MAAALKRSRAPSAPGDCAMDELAAFSSARSSFSGSSSSSSSSTSGSLSSSGSESESDGSEDNQAGDAAGSDNQGDGRPEDALERHCRRLARLLAGARHLVAFTGAGVSTSVGIPDYRGENGIRARKDKASKRQKRAPQGDVPDFHALEPSPTHMALFELHRLGLLKHVVSQNVDNLHLKSGIPPEKLTEVHGNATHAKCETCEKVYTRDFPWTGLCNDAACLSTKRPIEQRLRARTRHGNGRLRRNVVGFDEPLGDIDLAIDECEAADVALVLGTSLRVEPFSEMAGEYGESLIIVNLQPTTQKLDRRAAMTGVRLYEKCDVVMAKTMKYLMGDQSYEIPRWQGEHPTEMFIPEHEDKNLVNVLAGRLMS